MINHNNISENLRYLRKNSRMSQEYVAERIGVSRQAVAKWESGDSLPDILNCEALADLFDVSLNDLVRHDSGQEGVPVPPKDKHIFGTVTVGERGQIVLPKKARDAMGFGSGEVLVVLGDSSPENKGLALIHASSFLRMTGVPYENIFGKKENEG